MEQIEISIIMPVHNTGIYLEECLASLFAQTFQRFELLCVNDCSTDSLTLQILKCYQNKYSQMKVINLEQNVGAGEARNQGLKEAVGEYVIFLDSDDIYAEELLERMYSKCAETDADVCMCGFTRFNSQDETREIIGGWKPDILKLENKEDEAYFLSWSMRPTNKLFKKGFLIEHSIYFQSLSSQNDVFFSLMTAKGVVKKTYITDDTLIKVRRNIPTQISANRDPRNLVYAVELMEKTMKQRNQYDEILQKQLVLYLAFRGLNEMTKCRDENIQKECYLFIQNFLQQNQVSDDHKILYALYCNTLEQPYESRWFEPEIGYLWELHIYAEELSKCISDKKPLIVWGLGKRGDAFQQFCKEKGIDIYGVTDKKNVNVGSYTEYGNKIFSMDEVMNSEAYIVASNEDIYNELINIQIWTDIINLESYCPI